jgi:exopolysaccharide production protein ExoZ
MTAELQQTPPAANTPLLPEAAAAYSMAPVELPRYQLLDAFRGIAILWIVAFHLLEGVREQYGEVLSYIIGRGSLGVPIFFAIGGYGIAVSTLGGAYNGTPVSFITRRLKRIYPPYWWHLLFAVLVLPLCCAVLSLLKSGGFQWTIPAHTPMEWLEIATLTRVFAATDWHLNVPFVAVNGVVWYIAVVVQIYLFVGLCLCFKSHFVTSVVPNFS